MNDNDDTRAHEITHIADLSPDGGHYVGVLDDGRVVPAMTQEYAQEHHPDLLESGRYEVVMRRISAPQQRATCDGPAQVATDAYRENYDRIFRRSPVVGEA